MCNGLEISQDMRGQLFSSLSGGEKTRVNLANTVLEDTDILTSWTGPTNHGSPGPPNGWRSIWTVTRAPCWPSPTTAGSWTGWYAGSSRSDGKAEGCAGNYSFFM